MEYIVEYQRYKFVILHGDSLCQSLVFHVNPRKRDTIVGKELQKEIQAKFDFDIRKMRSHVFKLNEVFIPLKILKEYNPLRGLEYLFFVLIMYRKLRL